MPNATLRSRANVDDMHTYTRIQRLRYLGHIARAPSKITHALLFATHIQHPGPTTRRNAPRSSRTLVDQLREDVCHLFRDDTRSDASWYEVAQDRAKWRDLTRTLSACHHA